MNEARNITKMMQPAERQIGRYTFYIYPLPAFTAARLSADVISLFSPLVGGIAGAMEKASTDGGEDNGGDKKSLMDMDVSEAAPYIAGSLSSMSAEKVERLIRALLLGGHVAVRGEGSPDAEYLTEDKCDEVFRGNTQNMFILAFYVLKENYGDFFESIGNRSGNVKEALTQMVFPVTAPLT